MSVLKTHSSGRVPFYRRPITIIVFLLCLVAAGIATFFILKNNRSSSDSSVSTSTPSSSETPSTSPSPDSSDPDTPPDEPDPKVTPFEGEDPNRKPELTGRIAYHGIEQNNLVITASIDQYLQDPGTCRLNLIRDGRTVYSLTLPAHADITTSVCEQFRIGLDNLSPGEYNINITLTGDGKTGLIETKITI